MNFTFWNIETHLWLPDKYAYDKYAYDKYAATNMPTTNMPYDKYAYDEYAWRQICLRQICLRQICLIKKSCKNIAKVQGIQRLIELKDLINLILKYQSQIIVNKDFSLVKMVKK